MWKAEEKNNKQSWKFRQHLIFGQRKRNQQRKEKKGKSGPRAKKRTKGELYLESKKCAEFREWSVQLCQCCSHKDKEVSKDRRRQGH